MAMSYGSFRSTNNNSAMNPKDKDKNKESEYEKRMRQRRKRHKYRDETLYRRMRSVT